jgi:GNAT superfamily N-acetyltransferase
MAVSFVNCGAEQLTNLRAFFVRVYGPAHPLSASEPFFKWQFGRVADGASVKLAMLDGAIIGCLGYVPVEVGLAGRVVDGAWVINWMIDPEHRRLGLGPILMREVNRQFAVTLNVGPNADAQTVLSRMGWTHFGELPRYTYVADPAAAASLTEHRQLDWPEPPAIPRRADHVAVRMVDRFGSDATELWDRFAGSTRAGTRRSADYLNWRYAEHPLAAYRLLEAHRSGSMVGLAVYRIEQVKDLPVRVGRIVELICDAGAEDSLLHAVIEDAGPEVALIDFFCSDDTFAAGLTRLGFLPGDHPSAARLPVLFQPIDYRRSGVPFMAHLSKVGDQARPREWYVTKGDGDQDRPSADSPPSL